MKLQRVCLPSLMVVAIVMSIYSIFLMHLTKSFGQNASVNTKQSDFDSRLAEDGAASLEEELEACACSPESVKGLEDRRHVVVGLSCPYRYFDSNHWFHISEYYVSRHAHVASNLPHNGTVYIVAPHDLFVPNLIPMTFFLLLLAFTDGTATRAEVLPRKAVARLDIAGKVLALDNTGVESYVYDKSLPPFNRTRRYQAGERRLKHPRRLTTAESEGLSSGDAHLLTEVLAVDQPANAPSDAVSARELDRDREQSRRRLRGSRRRRARHDAHPHPSPERHGMSKNPAGSHVDGSVADATRGSQTVDVVSRVLTKNGGRDDNGDGAALAQGADGEQRLEAEFFPYPEESSQGSRSCACARYIGEFGAAPVERGYWFREQKVEDARGRIDALCGNIYRRPRRGDGNGQRGDRDGTLASNGEESKGYVDVGQKRKRMVVYQRDADRKILDLDELLASLADVLGPEWEIVVIVHDNDHEPCWLYSQLMDADILLTPHGFQSMLLLFLPPGATLLEVFPYKYWKEGYAPLAREWGVRHELIMSRPVSWSKRLVLFFVPLDQCMRNIRCRQWSRGADVRLEKHHVRQIVRAARAASKRKRGFLPPLPPAVAPTNSTHQRR